MVDIKKDMDDAEEKAKNAGQRAKEDAEKTWEDVKP